MEDCGSNEPDRCAWPIEVEGGDIWESREGRPLVNSDEDLAVWTLFGAYLEPAIVLGTDGGAFVE